MALQVPDLRHYICMICYSHHSVISHTHPKPSRTAAYADTWIRLTCDLSPAQDIRVSPKTTSVVW